MLFTITATVQSLCPEDLLDVIRDANMARNNLAKSAARRSTVNFESLRAIIDCRAHDDDVDGDEYAIDEDALPLFDSAAHGLAARFEHYGKYAVEVPEFSAVDLYEAAGAISICQPDENGTVKLSARTLYHRVSFNIHVNPVERDILPYHIGVVGLVPCPKDGGEIDESTLVCACIPVVIPDEIAATSRALEWMPPKLTGSRSGTGWRGTERRGHRSKF